MSPAGSIMFACKIDKRSCDHEFTENGDPQKQQSGDPEKDLCCKCGQSLWAWAFMEMP